jgi:hypothetical protein
MATEELNCLEFGEELSEEQVKCRQKVKKKQNRTELPELAEFRRRHQTEKVESRQK